VSVLGEQVRPFTFVIIEETQQNDFSIAGRPIADPQWLIGDEYKAILERAEQTIQEWIAQQAEQQGQGSQAITVVPGADNEQSVMSLGTDFVQLTGSNSFRGDNGENASCLRATTFPSGRVRWTAGAAGVRVEL
jgi:hypothetical protein